VTKDRYSELDFMIFYDLIFEINTRDDWTVEEPHVYVLKKLHFVRMNETCVVQVSRTSVTGIRSPSAGRKSTDGDPLTSNRFPYLPYTV